DDWLSQRQQEAKPANATIVKKNVYPAKPRRAKTKISYKQQKELELLPDTIELLETEQKALSQAMGEPGLYKKDKSEILAIQDRLESVKKKLIEAYARWQELEHLSL
ncbi:MAG: ABC transporter ATP-binding protein, partial [Dehalococcoidia bacterium]